MVAVSRAWLRTAATSLRTTLTAASLSLLVGLGAVSMLTEPPPPARDLGLSGDRVEGIFAQHRCSTTGFRAGVVPAQAVVRDGHGNTRLVSFDRGWAVFNGERPGELVAVCLGKHRGRGGGAPGGPTDGVDPRTAR